MEVIQSLFSDLHVSIIFIIGFFTLIAKYAGQLTQKFKLPSIIGFMVVGVLLGPSLFNILTPHVQEQLGFITDIALGFVALSIGLELSMSSLRRLGPGIVIIILLESFLAFAVVATLIYWVSGNLPMALIFGALAPASAPAGTVAIIHEYKAKGSLTKALYSVVGFDDGLGIIIFGFAAAIAQSLIGQATGAEAASFVVLMWEPLREVILSIGLGGIAGIIFCFLAQKTKSPQEILILVFALVFITVGLAKMFHLSLILTNMVIGMITVNTQGNQLNERIRRELTQFMPLLFVLFFTLAGAHLQLSLLPSLGIISIVYIIGRITGLVGGSFLGATLSGAEKKIRNNLGLGILSQAGVAIGLALIVSKDFSHLGELGNEIGATVLTTITATSIIFEIIGPICTKIALKRAGEIQTS